MVCLEPALRNTDRVCAIQQGRYDETILVTQSSVEAVIHKRIEPSNVAGSNAAGNDAPALLQRAERRRATLHRVRVIPAGARDTPSVCDATLGGSCGTMTSTRATRNASSSTAAVPTIGSAARSHFDQAIPAAPRGVSGPDELDLDARAREIRPMRPIR